MLLQFNFENFKSFKEEATLNFLAQSKRDLPFHIIKSVSNQVLPVAVLVGANASGKSNVIQALKKMTEIVIQSLSYGRPSRKKISIQINPYLFDSESENNPSLFEVFFTDDEASKIYQYGFKIKEAIIEEWLYVRSKGGRGYKTIFERDESKLDLSGIPGANRKSLEISLNKETLLVSLGASQRVEVLEKVYSWFSSLTFADYGNPTYTFFKETSLPSGFVSNPKIQEDVIEFLSSFDPDIKNFEVTEIDQGNYILYSLHEDHNKNLVRIPFTEESSGTLKMFSLYQDIMDVLSTGSVLIVDELNSRLHPLLLRSLVALFLDEERNPLHAQLIFASHDLWVLGCGLFRRDEIWFIEKNPVGESSLYSLAEFRTKDGKAIKVNENFERNYALGKYGAVPCLKKMQLKIKDKK
ncbi:MAG: ATP-binding protein [Allobaculum sp.]|nr:ATP-binding protein [Allobaculum sp.]